MDYKFESPVAVLQRRAEEEPNKLAYVFLAQGEIESETLTFADIDERAKRIASHLHQDYEPGTRALLLYPTGADFVSGLYGCLYAGVVPIPTNPPRLNRSAIRLQAILNDSQASLALTTTDFINDLPKRIEQVPELEKLEWLEHGKFSEEPKSAWQAPESTPQDLAFIQYTSGSTSSPKGVMINNGNIAYDRLAILAARNREPVDESVIVTWAPIFHDLGLIAGIIQGPYDNSLSVMMSSVAFLQRPVRWLQAITKYRGSGSGGPNFAYDLCVNNITEEECEGLDLSSWKMAFNSAEPVRAETHRNFVNKFQPYGFEPESFHPGYGLAEATLIVSCYGGRKETITYKTDRAALEQGKIMPAESEENENSQELISCGPALVDLELAIVNPDTKEKCAADEVGEIWVKGDSISPGYWNRPKETKETFQAMIANSGEGPFMRSGDLGFLYESHLYVTGRRKDLIIVKGKNYYPQDVEVTVEKSHEDLQPGGGAAFAIVVDDVEQLVVVQEVKREARKNFDLKEVSKKIRFAIARDQGIRAYAVVIIRPYSLPKTSSGKVMRHAALEQFLDDELKIVGEWRATQMIKKEKAAR